MGHRRESPSLLHAHSSLLACTHSSKQRALADLSCVAMQTAGEDLEHQTPAASAVALAPEAAAQGAAAAAAAATALGQLAAALASQAPLPDEHDTAPDTLTDSPGSSQAQIARTPSTQLPSGSVSASGSTAVTASPVLASPSFVVERTAGSHAAASQGLPSSSNAASTSLPAGGPGLHGLGQLHQQQQQQHLQQPAAASGAMAALAQEMLASSRGAAGDVSASRAELLQAAAGRPRPGNTSTEESAAADIMSTAGQP